MTRQVHVYCQPETLHALRRHRPDSTTNGLVAEALAAFTESITGKEEYPIAYARAVRTHLHHVRVSERLGVRVSYADRAALLDDLVPRLGVGSEDT